MSYERSHLVRSNDHHLELINAIEAQDGKWAEAVMASHILSAYQIYKEHYKTEIGSRDKEVAE